MFVIVPGVTAVSGTISGPYMDGSVGPTPFLQSLLGLSVARLDVPTKREKEKKLSCVENSFSTLQP